jgi:autotransporter passenger strand-loop-strand repeat protein
MAVNGGTMQMYGATTSITVGSGGIEAVNSGTVDSAATITLGGDQVVRATATAISATVATSGRQDVLGSASATLVSGLNGRDVVSSGGHVTGGRVFSGGIEQVLSGGTTTGTFVSGVGGAFATELLNAGGVASNTSVGSGGRILVSGGTTSNAVISSGGSELVFSGGTASSTTVSGGTETVSSGGVLAGATISGGGLVEIKASGSAGSSTITISSGTLKLDDSQHFSGSIAGLATAAQVVDLADINFATLQTVAYSGSTASGTLTVSDGSSHVAQLHLIGNYLAATFTSASDGAGGTLLTDPPVSGQSFAPVAS